MSGAGNNEGDGARNAAVLLTPPGAGAIAVVRIVGPRTGGFLAQCFSKVPLEGRCVHGELREGSRAVDDPVVVIGPGAAWADINVHGGPWIVQSTLELARRFGFQVIPRLEVPLQADSVDAGSAMEAEVLAYLPMARTEAALRRLLREEDLWSLELASIQEMAASEKARRARALLNDRSMYWLLHPPRVAIVGIANAGKSTLANQLFGQERSITADLPGTTRDWVGEIAEINGLAVMLVDTPGMRQTDDAIERSAIRQSEDVIASADLTVVVLDATVPSEDQRDLIRGHPGAIHVLNKADRMGAWDAGGFGVIQTVATTGQGVDSLRTAIAERFGWDGRTDRAGWWTPRQREILSSAGVAGLGMEAMISR